MLNYTEFRDFSWLEPHKLAASEFPSSLPMLRWLHQQGIRVIVTLTEYSLSDALGVPDATIAELGIVSHHAPLPDMQAPDSLDFTYQVMQFVNRMIAENQPVLVHCLAGQGRTGTLLHAYYLHQGLSLDGSRAKILAARPYSAWTELSDVQRDFLTTLAEGLQKGWRV